MIRVFSVCLVSDWCPPSMWILLLFLEWTFDRAGFLKCLGTLTVCGTL